MGSPIDGGAGTLRECVATKIDVSKQLSGMSSTMS
jgi:hypothetical protein